ncbi:MAG TPA: NUDIX hydrolase [Turneriella sp.]|nr:NUDIX hydrolase [Turneriella sp.]HMY11686.1 NUDIX hydrolase [Turneriella sp.]HNA79186.1 NUDIX hydrolase [Turneriella sp.]HNE21359.1 NUDIX hydrolase [Turneriella sp.]HNJ65742.1 NUDIX hydrolase [Turneriella sp.]
MKVLYRDKEIAFTLVKTRFGDKPLLQYPHAAGILPVEQIRSGKKFLWLVEQYRLGSGARSWEIPAGKKKNNETILQCAKRELAEEAGFAARHWKKHLQYHPAISFSTEVLHLFTARSLSEATAEHDDDEVFSNKKAFSQAELNRMVRNHRITDSKTLLALWIFEKL